MCVLYCTSEAQRREMRSTTRKYNKDKDAQLNQTVQNKGPQRDKAKTKSLKETSMQVVFKW